MYKTCPKCKHELDVQDSNSLDICPACGLVFSKWLRSLAADQQGQEARSIAAIPNSSFSRPSFSRPSVLSKSLSFFFPPRPAISRSERIGYAIIYLLFVLWGLNFIAMDFQSNEIGRSWFHNVDLIFHEAGHVLFIPFGRYGSILGGSLFQILVPLFLMFAFLYANKDGFAASICLWWCGQSIMDLAPYIADARALRLPLLGGGTGADSPGAHDWQNLLRPLGWLQHDIRIATVFDSIGSGVILLSLAWGARMLYIYYRDNID
jgi:hypothetical protein